MIPGIVASQRGVVASAPASFPIIRNAQAVASSGAAADLTVNYTASDGDLVIINWSVRSGAAEVYDLSDTGWTLLDGVGRQNGTSVSSFIFSKTVPGSGALTITPNTSFNMAAVAVVIEAGTHQGVIEATFNTGSGSPNTFLLEPSWGSAKTLWMSQYSQANGSTVSAYPLPDSNMHARSGTTTAACSTALCIQSLDASGLDPGGFTVSATGAYVGRTIGVRPA